MDRHLHMRRGLWTLKLLWAESDWANFADANIDYCYDFLGKEDISGAEVKRYRRIVDYGSTPGEQDWERPRNITFPREAGPRYLSGLCFRTSSGSWQHWVTFSHTSNGGIYLSSRPWICVCSCVQSWRLVCLSHGLWITMDVSQELPLGSFTHVLIWHRTGPQP